MSVRFAVEADASAVLSLMKKLAVFEGYIDDFKVTEVELIERAFKRQDFFVLVAEEEEVIAGILVYYFLPFSYDLTPWMLIKELYIDEECRGKGVGQQLMKMAAKVCVENGGSRMKWDVLVGNTAAEKFYEGLGARANEQWKGFQLLGDSLQRLAN